MRRQVTLIIICISALLIFCVQAGYAQLQFSCSCENLLAEAEGKIDSMYAGFNDKVTASTKVEYTRMTKRLAERAQRVHSFRECYNVLNEYTKWFHDKHLGVWYGVNTTSEDVKSVSPTLYLKQKRKNSGIEGIWIRDDMKEKWNIIPDPNHKNAYLAIVLKSNEAGWMPGMVKVEIYSYDSTDYYYHGMFYQNDFHGKMDGFTVTGTRLTHWFGNGFHRENAPGSVNLTEAQDVFFKKINPEFCYLRLAHFFDHEVSQLDSLIIENIATIHSTKNLIIDLRGNAGGNANTSQKMIELIYTNPILYPAWQYKSSPQIITETQNELNRLKLADPYKQAKTVQKKLILLQSHPNELVTVGDSVLRTCDSVSTFPQKVAILVDHHSGSSSEFFIFEAKQSKKTVVFGTNSAGGMDYGDAHSFPLSCGEYSLSLAWGRNGWIDRFGYKIDGIGFKPDVEIRADDLDWITFVVNHMNSGLQGKR